MSEAEKVLVFPDEVFTKIGRFTGFSSDVGKFMCHENFFSSMKYMDRGEAETNPNFKQLIPYCVIMNDALFFAYQRGSKGGETRLHTKWSIGVGGHINPGDTDGDSYQRALERELNEEVYLQPGDIDYTRLVGMLYDDSNEVGRVHFGMVHLVVLNESNMTIRLKDTAPELEYGVWMTASELVNEVDKFETWSQLIIKSGILQNEIRPVACP
jgi:predicted NUDIX family phosphoesterase